MKNEKLVFFFLSIRRLNLPAPRRFKMLQGSQQLCNLLSLTFKAGGAVVIFGATVANLTQKLQTNHCLMEKGSVCQSFRGNQGGLERPDEFTDRVKRNQERYCKSSIMKLKLKIDLLPTTSLFYLFS